MKGLSDGDIRTPPLLIKKLLQKVLFTAREFLHMEVAFISEFKNGYRVFKLVDTKLHVEKILSVDDSDPLEESYCIRVVDGRLPQLMQNATDVAEALKLPVTTSLPVGAHLSVPIFLEDGSVYGTFCCFSRYPDHSLTERDLDVMQAYGNLASTLISYFITEDIERLASRRQISTIIAQQQFHPVYQGIYHLKNMNTVGYEALTRFDCVSELTTEDWFNEASNVGMANELEWAAASRAMADLSKINQQQFLSINLSPDVLLNNPSVESLLGDRLNQIVIEITEHKKIQDYSAIARVLAPLRSKGLRLAVDDAGAGFASLRHILQLQPDIIKLDRSLIHNLDRDNAELALANALVTFANSTGADIIAEGVESKGELAALKNLGVKLAQGYLLARPGPLQNSNTSAQEVQQKNYNMAPKHGA